MLFCKIENGIIFSPETLPNRYENIVGGFNLLPESELNVYEFFRYIEPVYDPLIQDLGELILNSQTKTVTRVIVDRVLDINIEKQNKIKQAKMQANALLSSTDWYVTRKLETGEAIPEEISTKRQAIRDRCNMIETEILASTNVRNVLTCQIDYLM